MKATIVTHHRTGMAAKAIEAALRPDNESAPPPLKVRSRANGRTVISKVTGAQDLDSLLSTIDDLLLCLIATDRTLSGLKPKGSPQ